MAIFSQRFLPHFFLWFFFLFPPPVSLNLAVTLHLAQCLLPIALLVPEFANKSLAGVDSVAYRLLGTRTLLQSRDPGILWGQERDQPHHALHNLAVVSRMVAIAGITVPKLLPLFQVTGNNHLFQRITSPAVPTAMPARTRMYATRLSPCPHSTFLQEDNM